MTERTEGSEGHAGSDCWPHPQPAAAAALGNAAQPQRLG